MNKCIICGSSAEIHHIKTRKAYPQFKDEPWNHMALCRSHHVQCHAIGLSSFVKKYSLQSEMLKRKFFYYNGQWKRSFDA